MKKINDTFDIGFVTEIKPLKSITNTFHQLLKNSKGCPILARMFIKQGEIAVLDPEAFVPCLTLQAEGELLWSKLHAYFAVFVR